MNSSNASIVMDVSANRRGEKSIQLSGHWLFLARTICGLLFAFCLTVFCADLPDYFAQLQTVCRISACPVWQLTPTHVREFEQFGVTIESYAILSIVIGVISVIVWSAVGVFIAWHKSNDLVALLVVMLLATSGIGVQSATDLKQLTTPLVASTSLWFAPTVLIYCLLPFLFLFVFLLFPDGHFVPSWARWLLCVGFVLTGASAISAIFHIPFPPWFYILMFVICLGSGVLAQIYRYRHISTPIQQQQNKWIVLGACLGFLVTIGEYSLPQIFVSLSQPDSLYFVMFRPVGILILILAPLSYSFAILHSHLWGIDVLINRTLVYSLLTGLLVAVYVGLIIGLQSIMGAMMSIDPQSPLFIIVSTLAIVVLVQPARRHIQLVIDRRFYRRKYDAAQTLKAFSATLHEEIDSDQLRERLVLVVEEIMQPAHVSLWLLDRAPPPQGRNTRLLPHINEAEGD